MPISNGQRFLRYLESVPNILGCLAGIATVVVMALFGPGGPLGFSVVAGVYLVAVTLTWLALRRSRGPGHEDEPPPKPRRAAF